MKNQTDRGVYRGKVLTRRKRRKLMGQLPYYLIGLLIIGILGGITYKAASTIIAASEQQSGNENQKNPDSTKPDDENPDESGSPDDDKNSSEKSSEPDESDTQINIEAQFDSILKEAELLAAGYDYDAAIRLLKTSGFYAPAAGDGPETLTGSETQNAGDSPEASNGSETPGTDPSAEGTSAAEEPSSIPQIADGASADFILSDGTTAGAKTAEAIAAYENVKTTLQPVKAEEITHVFFHSLVMDEAKAFDGDAEESGYNQVMTTKDEFLKILNSMYEKGFVLVRLHDIAVMEDGRMVRKEILLPPGKKAFVMSQDDVCYYEYMADDGFASRMVIGEDGKPTCEMVLDDGTVTTGSYDLVPILEDFITEHPDFSYRGARAVIAFTGYQGILGYRTAASYKDTSSTYEEDRRAAAAVAQCLRDNGWELASHSWGHRDLGEISYDKFKTDCDRWENEVESLIGPTDIILYPFGADINDWHPYNHDNERFNYLKSLGFDYFCNVDSTQYWVQIGNDYMRQGRRNLDGYRMWMDIAAGKGSSKRKLDDLFTAEDVFSSNRPTPVVWE